MDQLRMNIEHQHSLWRALHRTKLTKKPQTILFCAPGEGVKITFEYVHMPEGIRGSEMSEVIIDEVVPQ